MKFPAIFFRDLNIQVDQEWNEIFKFWSILKQFTIITFSPSVSAEEANTMTRLGRRIISIQKTLYEKYATLYTPRQLKQREFMVTAKWHHLTHYGV